MPIDSENLALKGLDDLFSTEENRQEEQREQVQQIPIDALHPFTNHPFKVLDDEAMTRTVESIAQYGVLAPLIARPRPEGGYEIISGHRRQHAAQLAGLDALPVIVRNMDDDAAVLLMVDSNLQRENILPSERAFAYKMKLEAIKNQGARSDLTSGQIVQKSKLSIERVAEDAGEGYKTVQRFIRLTNLVPELLDMVDEKKISFNPAVELSYLDTNQQRDFLEAMQDTQNAPSLSQAQRLKKLAQEGHFSYDVAFAVMGEEKKGELDKVVIKNDTLRKYFPRSYTPKQMEDTIIKLLDQWQRMVYDDKKAAGERLLLARQEMPNADMMLLGTYRGFELNIRFDSFKNEHQAVLRAELSYPVSLGDDARGNITRLDNAIDNFADRIADAENALQNLEQQKQAAEVEVAKPFAQEEELAEKSARLAELNALLNIDRSSAQDSPEKTEETPTTRPSVLAALEEKVNQPEPVKPFKSYLDKEGR